MRQLFAGHFRLTDQELSTLWETALFVFDTNALLNLYRYTQPTRDELFGLLELLQERVWIPYQVAEEFFANRHSVIREQVKAYGELDKLFNDALGTIKQGLQRFSRHSQIDAVRLIKEVDKAFMGLRRDVQKAESAHPDLLTQDDPVLDRIARVLQNRIMERPSAEQRADKNKWAVARLDKDIPPGFADKKKEGDRSLGDALIWKEILDLATSEKKAVVFVTDDVKDDWWLRFAGKTIGPLPALRQEFVEVTGQIFHMYQVEQFLKYGGEHLNTRVTNTSINEAAQIRARVNTKRFRDGRDLTSTYTWKSWDTVSPQTFVADPAGVLALMKSLEDQLQVLAVERETAIQHSKGFPAEPSIHERITNLTEKMQYTNSLLNRMRSTMRPAPPGTDASRDVSAPPAEFPPEPGQHIG
ncbi:hypothetical protein ADM96_11335 [Burkholderia sp. ST111]|nr:hypothetical protein ADM96_11335 [Burkholderia sp. ST111]